MKMLSSLYLFAALILLSICTSFTPVEHGIYAQLLPGSGKKFVVQISPDKTYSNVVVHVNFYSANNKRVGQKAYSLSDDKDKYVRKDKVTSKVFKYTFDDVSRVKIDYVNENEILSGDESKGGTKLNLAVVDHALEPVGR